MSRSYTKTIADAAELLYRNSIGGIVICMLASSVLVFAFPDSAIYEQKLIWWAAINVLMSMRLIETLYWHRQSETARNGGAQNWLLRFRVGAILTALCWGVFGALSMPWLADVEFVTTVIILSALAGAAPTPLSADRFLAVFYSCLLIVPISVAGIFDAQYMRQVLGFMGIFFALTMVFNAFKISRFTSRAIFLKNHNYDLLQQASIDKQQLSLQNQELEAHNDKILKVKNSLADEVERRTEQLRHLSQHDGLTGLFNRTSFIDAARQQLEDKHSAQTVFFIDLNKFKLINDSQGHGTGDRVLKKVANLLSELPGEPISCRWGGDEFVLMIQMDGNDMALQYAELIGSAIKNESLDFGFDVSAAIGIAMCPNHASTAEELIRRADIAMFEHKKQPDVAFGVIFEQRFLTQLERLESLRNGLSKAIAQNELYLLFQPVFDLRLGTAVSYEALVRWQFGGQQVEPEEFIPIAENSGMISSIGLWVIENAILSVQRQADDDSVRLAVNVSVQQVKHPEFADAVITILNKTGFPPERLHLEITESVFCDKPAALLRTFSVLAMHGVTLGLDDFGTGYSSMVQLQAFPFSSIKLDKRFVSDLEGAGGAIIRSVVQLADELGMTVIVEGVENQRQLNWAYQNGINTIQGYFCSKPLKVPEPHFKPAVVFDQFRDLH